MIQNLIFNVFFGKYFFGHTTFLYSSTSSSGHHYCFFFNFRYFSRKSQSQQKLPKKITNFTIQFRSTNLTHFMKLNSLDIKNNIFLQHSQKPFWLYEFSSKHVSVWGKKKHLHPIISWRPKLHSWSILKANDRIFLYISVRKDLFQRRSKILSDGWWNGGRLNNFLKVSRCLDLVKCFTIFHFNWNCWKFNYFSAFWYFHL